jgi:ankyrin repeat protein
MVACFSETSETWSQQAITAVPYGGTVSVIDQTGKTEASVPTPERKRAAKPVPTHATALHIAAREGHVGVCQLLLAHGASAAVKDRNGNTALHLAAWPSPASTSNSTSRHGQRCVGAASSTFPLQLTTEPYAWLTIPIKASAAAIATLLIDNGAPLDARNMQGQTPLLCAAAHGQEAACLLLIDRGADVFARDLVRGIPSPYWERTRVYNLYTSPQP